LDSLKIPLIIYRRAKAELLPEAP